MIERPLLTPVLVSGCGRSGSTALMALLGTDPRVAFDRKYPFENRHLTYLTKLVLLAERPANPGLFNAAAMSDFDDDHFGPMPWVGPRGRGPVLADLWPAFSNAMSEQQPGTSYYAEKTPTFVPDLMRSIGPVQVIHLVRDPRDVFLSARVFASTRGAIGFGMDPERSLTDHVRQIARGWLACAEIERADRGRADAIVVRYEDWAANPSRVAEQLSAFLGLDLSATAPEVTEHLSQHKTSADLGASVGRWRREPLPESVRDELPRLVSSFLKDYGYEGPADSSPPVEIVLDPAWQHSADGTWKHTPDGVAVTLNGGDAYIELPPETGTASPNAEIWLCIRGDTGDHHSVYWRGPSEVFSEERAIHIPFHPGPHWQLVSIPLGKHLAWRGPIAQLRFDLFNGAVRSGSRGFIRWIRRLA